MSIAHVVAGLGSVTRSALPQTPHVWHSRAMTETKYRNQTAECQRHNCARNVWVVKVGGGKMVRVQTPYCEMHARDFSDTWDDERRYGG